MKAPYQKAKRAKTRYTGKKELDLKETINHCNIMAKKKDDETNADIDRAERQIRHYAPHITSGSTKEYRESSFWDHIHGEDIIAAVAGAIIDDDL